MTKSFLSIVTITKDNPDGFDRTAASLAAQSVQGFNWVVVDGAIEPDTGIYDAMNKGISRSHGDYLLFLNAGDEFADPETLSLIKRHIAVMPSDFIYGDAMEEIDGKLMVKKARSHTGLALGMFTHHQAMIYKRSVIGDLRYNTTYKIAGDYDFTAKHLKRCTNISYIPAPICLFERGGVSQRNAALGRQEEFLAKLENKICGPISAARIFVRQAATNVIKQASPKAYTSIRQAVGSRGCQ